MARKAVLENDELLIRLSTTFRDMGYEAASLVALADAAGLKKASLYHRFPGGKEEMGREVLRGAGRWLSENVLEPLAGDGTPNAKIQSMVQRLDDFYQGGTQACLFNLLSSPLIGAGPFQELIQELFETFISAMAAVVVDAGFPPNVARGRAERAVALIQGSLVLSRGLGSTEPFRKMLKSLPAELLAI